ncbi:glycosyltransferase family 2 protein [Pinibacter soli]|uniref:Glycosyltransferase family 2 protein n=1 Tax=Pinibacter soli TaxID=3044211 RepID=A0ABT6RHY0_9BACT|nr:glycosyltransferase family 2 protein [Pinibacter soli]MDI3322138.1 glycosyltransferase family 2 protein [Pinibacter soli]
MTKLSIITINLNNADGLKKTIESIINQTFTNYEYIIIDGNSTDESVSIIKQHSEKINYWVSEPDAGIYNAMNKGVIKATGEYCLFLNSGDYLINSNILDVVFHSKNPNEDFVYGNIMRLNKNGKEYEHKAPEKLTFFTFYFSSSICHQAIFYKRDLFQKYGLYNEDNRIASDWEFNTLVIIKHNCTTRYLNEPISFFEKNNLSANEEMNEMERQKALRKHFDEKTLADYEYFKQLRQTPIVSYNLELKSDFLKATVLFYLKVLVKIQLLFSKK